MHSRCLMGDYNFGIPPNVTALPPVDYQQIKNGGQSFYGDTHTTSEELLMDKTSQSVLDKQSEAQQLSNGEDLVNHCDVGMDEFANCKAKGEDIDLSSNNQMEKHMIEASSTSGTPSSHLQLEFSDAVTTTSAPNFWSGVTGDDHFNPCVPPPMKNPLSFQNFPNSPNPMFNSSLGPQINIPQSLPQQRRAITGAHNFSQSRLQQQQQQSSLLKPFSNWSNPQSASWSAPQTPNEMLPWNAINLVNQKRTVPNINPVCPQKKNPPIGQHSMVISPSKFRRSTSLPLNKQYPHSFGGNPPFDMSTLEESREGNMMYPFQDHQIAGAGSMNTNSMEGLRFPLEQQLMDIMRTSNAENQDHFKGYANYSANNIQSMGNMQDLCMIMCKSSGCKSSLSDFRNNDVSYFNGNSRRFFLWAEIT